MAKWKKVYHTTEKGIGQKIANEGWLVSNNVNIGQIYGRGIYFWELIDDAHKFGKRFYGENNYDIVSEKIPFKKNNVMVYDRNKRNTHNPDYLSQGLLNRGIEILKIKNAYMEMSTLNSAKGYAFVWLVDINIPHIIVK